MKNNKDKSPAQLEGEKAFLDEKDLEYLRCFQLCKYKISSDDFNDFVNGYILAYRKHFNAEYKIEEFTHEFKQLLNKYKVNCEEFHGFVDRYEFFI